MLLSRHMTVEIIWSSPLTNMKTDPKKFDDPLKENYPVRFGFSAD